jgi:hypothetical protein
VHSNRAELFQMLAYMRPASSDVERAFNTRFIETLPGVWRDQSLNWHVKIGESPILWSCHTDTVHRQAGYQTTHFDIRTQTVSLSRKSRQYASCLGADDTAGVWLCRQMILRGIPGHYIFHHAEEIGGIGSMDLAENTPNLLDGVQFAIALDRKGTSDIITHQFCECCSDTFALSLGRELNKSGLKYQPSLHGVFTDTANYTAIVGECTNLSVGYANAHSAAETLNVGHLERLLEALCTVNPDNLVSERIPHEDNYLSGWSIGNWNNTTDRTFTYVDVSDLDPEDRPTTYKSRFEFEHCDWCGQNYMLDESNATDFCKYCDADCERYATTHESTWTEIPARRALASTRSSIYLDPDYQDVIDSMKRGRP